MRRALALTLTTAFGLALLASPAGADVEPDPAAGSPAAGACYDLTVAQVEGFDTPEPTVDCAEDHTVVVSGVGMLPDGVGWGQDRRVGEAVAAQCPPTWWELLGSKDARQWYRSAYQTWWLAPSEEDRDAGARWFSCLVTVLTGQGLVDLPDRLPKLSRENLPDSVARCVTSQYKTTVCSQAHAWRSSHAFYASGTYTDRHVKAAARRVCPRHVESERYLYSSRDLAGDRFLVGCYTKTRR